MSSNMLKMMSAICLLLVAILFVEWQFWSDSAESWEQTNSSQKAGSQGIELPKIKSNEKSQDDFTVMVERPLFVEGRRPVDEDSVFSSAEPVDSKIDNITLEGIYSIQEQKFALFSQQGKESKYNKIPEGELISGWELSEIHSDKVIMERAGEKKTLILRKPKPKKLKARAGKSFQKKSQRKRLNKPLKKVPQTLDNTKIKLQS